MYSCIIYHSIHVNDVKSSSDSSSGELSSSLENEFSSSSSSSSQSKTSSKSCFTAPWCKPVMTGIALRLYANLKKAKKLICPNVRLRSFIKSPFTSASPKESNKKCSSSGTRRKVRFFPICVVVDEDGRPCGHKCIYGVDSNECGRPPSTCSSSVSRSCLRKTTPPPPPGNSGEKMMDSGTRRTVRFHPVCIIVDEDSRQCGHKYIYDADSKYVRSPLPQNAKEQKLNQIQNDTRKKNEGVGRESLKTCHGQKKDAFAIKRIISHPEEDDNKDYDDSASDSSSDLFEIDHLSFFGN